MEEHIRIKTRFESIEACKEACVDKRGRSKLFSASMSHLYGEFDQACNVVITTSNKSGGPKEFIGEMVEEDGFVVLKGVLQSRADLKKLYTIMFIALAIFSLVLISSFNPVFIFMAVLMMLVIGLNLVLMSKSRYLLKLIEKKVS